MRVSCFGFQIFSFIAALRRALSTKQRGVFGGRRAAPEDPEK